MATYTVKIVERQPTFRIPLAEILATLEHGGAIKTLTPLEHHTDRQRRWYRGVCLAGLADWSGDTIEEWDGRLKGLCGGGLLKKEPLYVSPGVTVSRLSIAGVGKRKMTQFIENILSAAITNEWPVTPPDHELRSR